MGDPVAFLAKPLSQAALFEGFQLPSPHYGRRQRDMRCTAPLLHAAGRRIVEAPDGGWITTPRVAAGQREKKVFEFVPVRVAVDDSGRTTLDFQRAGAGRDVFLFKVAQMRAYDEIMAGCLRDLFESFRAGGPDAACSARAGPSFDRAKEWRRSGPDAVMYLPKGGAACDGDNESLCVFKAPKSDELLALWTQSSVEGHGNNRLMLARSRDGLRWSEPTRLAGTRPGTREPQASWGVPVVSSSGRIYVVYVGELARSDYNRQESGGMGCATSDDNGVTWKTGQAIAMPRNQLDHPDPKVPKSWWLWTAGTRDRRGRYILGYTHTSSPAVRPKVSKTQWMHQDTRCAFVRLDNLDEGPDPKDLKLTWLPRDSAGLEVADPMYPGRSVSQEPSLVLLPDGRLLCAMRTVTGMIHYSVSGDDGRTWRKPEPLRYRDGGLPILEPTAPCPIIALEDGRYLLLFHNNDGCRGWYSHWKKEWEGNEANHLRNPAWIALGQFRPKARQPLWFSVPRQILDTHGVIVGPKGTAEVATYASLVEWHGRRMLWYPDRKYFLLGKELPDALLQQMEVPR